MHHPTRPTLGLVASATAASLLLAACGGGNDDNPVSAAPATRGTLAVGMVAGAPACGLDAVNLSVTRLRFRQDFNTDPNAGGWTDLNFSPAKRINLLHAATALSGAALDLGEVSLPTGAYTQMAVVLDSAAGANTVRVSGASGDEPLEVAAKVASGFRVPIDLRVDSGGKGNVLVDFNACDSFQMRGATYVFKPRPRLAPAVLNGIGGFVDKAMLGSGVVITAQKGGTILATTVPHQATGEFVLPRLGADNYDVVLQANGRATGVIGSVPVGATGVTSVATAAAPLRLATSAVSSISGQVSYVAPAVAPEDGTWIMASQSITAVPASSIPAITVTSRLQPVDLATGNYTLNNLARASITWAPYSAAATPNFAAVATGGGNGRYRVEALATGYINKTGASANINVSSGNQAGVNITMP